MKSGKNLIISFVLILILGLYFLILSYKSKEQAESLNKWVIHTHLVIEGITNANTLTTEFESQDYSYVITSNINYIKDINLRERKLSRELEKIKQLTVDNPAQQKNMQLLQNAFDAKVANQKKIFDVLKKSQKEALILLSDAKTEELYFAIKKILASMLDIENALLKQRTTVYQKTVNGRFTYAAIIELLSVLTLAIAFIKIYKESTSRRKAEEELKKSEVKYKRLTENSSLLIFTIDLQGNFTYISNKSLELTGYTMEELIGKPFDLLIKKDQKKEIRLFYLNQYKNFIKGLVEEFEINTKDNNTKIIQLSTVLIEEKGKITGFQSVARDITEVKYIENLIKDSKVKLQQQHEEHNFRLQKVLDNIPLILYIRDLEGKYLTVNKKFREMVHLTDEMIIGKTKLDFHGNEKIDTIAAEINLRIKNTGKPIEFEEVVMTADGERNLLISKFPLFDKDNKMFAIGGVAKDITDMAHHRNQLIDARQKAEKAEQLQEAFLANMSHEIRTPMNGIIGMTNILLDTPLDDEQKEYAGLIKKSSDSLLILINDILDLSKIKAGRMELEAIDFNIKEAVQNVVQLMKAGLKRNVALNCAFSDLVPDFVKGDLHKLFQILNNLLSNAAKFTEGGEIKVNVDVTEKGDKKIYINISVSDTGIGISAEHIKTIFESFTQAGSDTVRRFGGTGLGLAITKRLVELQDGNIYVESTPGQGTVFHLEIPYLPARKKPKDSKQKTGEDEKNNIDKGAGVENCRILVVEDNVVNQRVLTSVLKKMKTSWEIANNGQEAIEKLESGNWYHLIIMDLQMPVMGGLEAAAYIRNQLKLDVPILAMTASTLRNEREECFNIGMNDYLAKPFSPNELIEHVQNLIRSTNIKEKQMIQEKMPAEKLYDLEYLLELDDYEYLAEMLELFFVSTSEMLDEIQEAVKNKSFDAVAKTAHKIKSSLGPLQVNKMIVIASAMEENAKYKNDLNDIIQLNKELNNQYGIVKPLIEAELAKARKMSNGFAAY